MNEAIDWQLAATTAVRFAPSGPDIDVDDARAAVRDLRACAVAAIAPVRDVTGLVAPDSHPASVVDRREWIASNISGLQEVLGRWPLLAERAEAAPAVVRELGSRGTALQLGAVLAWLSTKVLGQYEIFAQRPGRLLLVAPSIVQAEQALDIPPHDFRLWVCLHEETHRVQFGAVPWLGDHLIGLIVRFLDASELGLRETLMRCAEVVYAAVRSIRSEVDVMHSLLSPAQRIILDDVTAVMTLLEGHADVVMDAVGPQVVPSVALIRQRFTERRENPSAVDAVMRKAMGMDAKFRQYSEGAAFVRSIVTEVGMEGFNKIWHSPETLPTRREIDDPQSWLARVA